MKNRYIESKLDIRHLKNFTKNTMFKISINKRKKEVGKIFYKGWSLELYKEDNYFLAVANLYFFVQGKKYFDKQKRKYVRPTYLEILQIPYKKSYKESFDVLYEKTPIKIFSSDPSFKFYLAYALNKANAVVINDYTKKELGIALSNRPIINNPFLHKEFNKHFYKLVEFIAKRKVAHYLNDKYYLGINKMPNLNKLKSKG